MNELKPIHILLVEDNEDHAELMTDSLEEFNVRNTISHVTNGEEALAFLRKQPPFDKNEHTNPDLIFLDIKMPRLNGVETLKLLKADKQLNYIPVIMISTTTTDHEIQQCYELGASGYVTKPIQFEEFTRKIKALNLYWVLTSELPKNFV